MSRWSAADDQAVRRRFIIQLVVRGLAVAATVWLPGWAVVLELLNPLTSTSVVGLVFSLALLLIVVWFVWRRKFPVGAVVVAVIASVPFMFAAARGGWVVLVVLAALFGAAGWLGAAVRRMRKYVGQMADAKTWQSFVAASRAEAEFIWIPDRPTAVWATGYAHRGGRWVAVSIPPDAAPASWLRLWDGAVDGTAPERARLAFEALQERKPKATTQPTAEKGASGNDNRQ